MDTNDRDGNLNAADLEDLKEMRRQLRALTDRSDINDLLSRYLRALDDGVFDDAWVRAFHTEDVAAEMPIGIVRGRAALLDRVRRGMALFDRTMHLSTNTVIEIDGDRATAQGAQLNTHVLADGTEGVFISATRSDTDLMRTADGWRISASALRVVWTQGPAPRVPDDLAQAAAGRPPAGQDGQDG